ncbi:hypothetical protein L1887_20619 [Cichorium endivia]|nr:hypothetical protein L1887_20619 [Cichorium endivia]
MVFSYSGQGAGGNQRLVAPSPTYYSTNPRLEEMPREEMSDQIEKRLETGKKSRHLAAHFLSNPITPPSCSLRKPSLSPLPLSRCLEESRTKRIRTRMRVGREEVIHACEKKEGAAGIKVECRWSRGCPFMLPLFLFVKTATSPPPRWV